MEAVSRTEKVIITAQGIVLKKLREECGLSMVEAGKQIGAIAERGKKFSATYISQVENHRTAPPSGDTLRAFLEIYKISRKHYEKLCRQWKNKLTDDEFIKNTIHLLSDSDKKYIRTWIEDKLRKRF